MRKSDWVVASLLFLCLLILVEAFGIPMSVKSVNPPANQYPTMYVSPTGVTDVNVGETFTVTVSVSGLYGKNLYGFDIVLRWDTSALQYVSHEVKVPVETYPEGVLYRPFIEVKDEVDLSAGTCWLAYASLCPAEPFNDDGVFFTITFVLIQASENPYALAEVTLVNKYGEMIPLDGFEGENSVSSSGQKVLTPLRILRNEEWLEWWLTIITHWSKRKQSTVG